MKTIIKLLLINILFYACGSRSVEKEEHYQRLEGKSNIVIKSEGYFAKNEALKIDTELRKTLFSKGKYFENKSGFTDIESNSHKSNEENNSKKLKRTDYYSNGNKKSELEFSEQYSKIYEEKDYYKTRSEQFEKKLKISIKTQDSIYKQNLDFAARNESLIKINKESISKLEKTKNVLRKESERKGVSFGALVWIVVTSLIIGAIASQLIRLYLKRNK